jgi:hypothetical protein
MVAEKITQKEINPMTETTPTPTTERNPALSPMAGTSDNALMKWFVGVGAFAFFVTLILWTATLTMDIMNIVLPHNPAAKYYALALFDGGALIWLGMFVYKAKGTPQRGASLLLFVLDFLGVVLMTAGGVYMGGQSLADIPEWMGYALVNGIIGATLANVGAAYYYHMSSPETREEMAAQSLEDTLSEEAMRQARVNIQREARNLGAIMARRATSRIKYRLALPMTDQERAEWDGETIDAQEVPALPAPADEVPGWVKAFFGLFAGGRNSRRQPSEPITTSNSNDSNSNEPDRQDQ